MITVADVAVPCDDLPAFHSAIHWLFGDHHPRPIAKAGVAKPLLIACNNWFLLIGDWKKYIPTICAPCVYCNNLPARHQFSSPASVVLICTKYFFPYAIPQELCWLGKREQKREAHRRPNKTKKKRPKRNTHAHIPTQAHMIRRSRMAANPWCTVVKHAAYCTRMAKKKAKSGPMNNVS